MNLKTLEYEPKTKVKFDTLGAAKSVDDVSERMKVLFHGKDKAGEFYRRSLMGLFQYVSHRIPEITDDIYKIDDALKAGFGWELGPFEIWDALGAKEVVGMMEEAGQKPAEWINELLANNDRFYKNCRRKQTIL